MYILYYASALSYLPYIYIYFTVIVRAPDARSLNKPLSLPSVYRYAVRTGITGHTLPVPILCLHPQRAYSYCRCCYCLFLSHHLK